MKTTKKINHVVALVLVAATLMFNLSCKKENTLSINCNEITDHQSVLFLVESANVEVLKDSSELNRFLSNEEMNKARSDLKLLIKGNLS